MEIILSAVVGSRAYGWERPDSDTDILGVFLSPTVKVAGLDWHSSQETWTDSSPTGDDHTFHELGKFLRLCLKANPTLIELLFVEHYVILEPIGEQIIALRENFLSSALRESYGGFCWSIIKSIAHMDEGYEKRARHALRLARQGRQLLTTGHLDVRIADSAEYFALTDLPKDDMLLKLAREINLLRDSSTILPDAPNDGLIRNFLESVREIETIHSAQKRTNTGR